MFEAPGDRHSERLAGQLVGQLPPNPVADCPVDWGTHKPPGHYVKECRPVEVACRHSGKEMASMPIRFAIGREVVAQTDFAPVAANPSEYGRLVQLPPSGEGVQDAAG